MSDLSDLSDESDGSDPLTYTLSTLNYKKSEKCTASQQRTSLITKIQVFFSQQPGAGRAGVCCFTSNPR